MDTNNLSKNGTEQILSKYKDLLHELRELKCRKVSVVGIFVRARDGNFQYSRRVSVNSRLGELCTWMGFKFIDPISVYSSVGGSDVRVQTSLLDRWGLHFNQWGQHEVAAFLFKHCVHFLG